MADQGAIARTSKRTARRITDYRASRSSPIPYRVLPAGIRFFMWHAQQPEQYWLRPLVLDGRRGQLNWSAGSNSLFRIAEVTTSAADPDGWRWNGPWIERLGWYLKVGSNRIVVQVMFTTDTTPRPTVRVQSSARLGVLGDSAQAAPGVGQWQTIELEVSAVAAGVAVIQLEWLLFAEHQNCVWRNVRFFAP